MHYVYIIYSESTDKFYVGQTENIERRIYWHNTSEFQNSYTIRAIDWKLFYSITCKDKKQALKIEKHIKSMKSRKYYMNLKKYPEISQKLLSRY